MTCVLEHVIVGVSTGSVELSPSDNLHVTRANYVQCFNVMSSRTCNEDEARKIRYRRQALTLVTICKYHSVYIFI